MKRKLKAKYINRINSLLKYTNGLPLKMIISGRFNNEEQLRHYKWYNHYSRTKRGRLDGSYEDNFGIKPSRIAHGYENV